MDNRNEIREFLTSRRTKITPERAGLPAWGGHRRVAGLRREEVALLAGVSVDYYTRLERGNAAGASDSVLEALARALQLDEAEHAHLFDLVHAANTSRAARAPRPPTTPGSCSWTPARGSSTSSGSARPRTPSRCCGPRPAATPTTRRSPA